MKRVLILTSLLALSACANVPRWTLAIDRVGPTYVPAVDVSGTVQRVVAVEITGSPDLLPPLLEKAQAEGWKARLVDGRAVEIDPVGHSIDQVTALTFRLNNGEFGDLRTKVLLRPDGQKKS